MDCPCIHRGPHKIFTPIKGADAFKCFNRKVPEDRCIIVSTERSLELAPKYNTAVCSVCVHRVSGRPIPEMDDPGQWRFIPTSQLVEDSIKLIEKLPNNISGVVGCARSGLIPATAIATHMHLPLYAYNRHSGLINLGSGYRGWKQEGKESLYETDGPLLFVDDSIYGGNTMWAARSFFLERDMIFAAIYVHPENKDAADIYFTELPSPHLFEWNMFNNGMVEGNVFDKRLKGGLAFDFDGIFCPDCPVPDADDGPGLDAYLDWMKNAPMNRVVPRYVEIPLIVTFRLERWRSITEDWLRRHGIKWKKLVMSPYETASERNRNFDVEAHKAKAFMYSDCSMFVESDPLQAEIIHSVTRLPVLCPDEKKVYQRYCHFHSTTT